MIHLSGILPLLESFHHGQQVKNDLFLFPAQSYGELVYNLDLGTMSDSSSKRTIYPNGSSSNYHNITDDSGPSSSRASRDGNSKYSSGNGNNGLPQALKAAVVFTGLFIEKENICV